MANAITLAKEYIALLDKEYKVGAKTSVLDVAPALVKAAANAGEFNVQKLALVGLGDYSKTAGFPAGDITATWETHTYDYDRGREFTLDAMDELEAMGIFGNVAGEFLRMFVTPEIDLIRFKVLAAAAVAAGTYLNADIDSAADTVSALNTGLSAMEENEVPSDRLVLFITPTLARLVRTQGSTASVTDALDRCTVVEVPSARFYSDVTLDAGATADAGGYTVAGYKLNFMIVDRGCCFADAKHTAVRYFPPDVNQTADAYKFQYRIYHDAFVYENKRKGVYAHYESAVS